MRSRAAEWVGGIARIVAWAGLTVALAIVFVQLLSLLPFRAEHGQLAGYIGMTLAALAAGAILVRGADGRSPVAIGIAVSRHTPREVGVGVVIGAAGLAVAAIALLISGSLRYGPQAGTATGWVATVSVQAGLFAVYALFEEALFRGYAFQVLVRVGGAVFAIVLSSLLFALAHGRNPSMGTFAMINIFLAGTLLAVAYLRTLSLWFATAVHLGWNWAMATLFDLPVSGLTTFDTPLYQPSVGGPGWWSGGAFGPEGGLVGTIGFGVALLMILRWKAVRPDPAVIAARPLVLTEEEP
ncbi:MAG: CPBP family intramembrane metalloprotease [Gemmatimonadetes bacterium]|nr:CPBP family intramembrane metalloprotease [Gemmatimonadota bacterium]